jgi:hypothetical protein
MNEPSPDTVPNDLPVNSDEQTAASVAEIKIVKPRAPRKPRAPKLDVVAAQASPKRAASVRRVKSTPRPASTLPFMKNGVAVTGLNSAAVPLETKFDQSVDTTFTLEPAWLDVEIDASEDEASFNMGEPSSSHSTPCNV